LKILNAGRRRFIFICSTLVNRRTKLYWDPSWTSQLLCWRNMEWPCLYLSLDFAQFPVSGEPSQTSRRQKGDTKQVPYWGSTNVRRHCTNFFSHGDLAARFCAPFDFNPLNAEINPICHLLALSVPYHIFHVSILRINGKYKQIRRILSQLNGAISIAS
jgi:hypothetical protein